MSMKCFLAFAAESLLVMAIVLFTLGWKSARICQFTLHSLRIHIDSWDQILLMGLTGSQIEIAECVRGNIGQVDVDRFKQVTQVFCGSSVSHYLRLRPASLPGYA